MDLGCNVGTFSLWVYPQADKIWAVDMEQKYVDFLNENIKDNNLQNVSTYTERVLNLAEFMSGHSINNVDVLKIDVEGDEYEIFAKDIPHIPTIIGEHHRGSLRDLLEAKGYRYTDIEPNKFIARK